MRWSALVLLVLRHVSATAAQCGVPTGQTKIVGGQSVTSLRYPWYVALVSSSPSETLFVTCGGSLITNRHVLSAAHCFPRSSSVSPENLYRAVFELVDRCNNPDVPDANISRVDINPGYNTDSLEGDVAVVTLARSVSFTPICLPPRNSMNTGAAIIIGFGSTLVKSTYPCTMQEAQVNIFSRRQCARSALPPEYSQLPGTICAGVRRGGVDSCDGDSGGPLQTAGSDGVYTIQGIVSFGQGCARQNLPGVYTQVSAYRDFIDSIISEPAPGDGCGDRTNPSNADRPRILSFLQELLLFLHHLTSRDSSSGAGDSSGGDRTSPDDVTTTKTPLTPLEAFLHGLGFFPSRNQPNWNHHSPNQLYTTGNRFSSDRNQLYPYGNHFYPQRNQFSANRNQFSANRNQFSANQNQFSANRNQFSANRNQFSANRNGFYSHALTQA